ncbi:sterol desaturase family protein [Fibrella aquatilis]|uniref:Sterol desaturase family protein n=1 Tax=Fibrella aquatilis TaxID=2817059 RepID=A0A939G4B9_9BACT|nr:sterol desaturase family protein [Fibrella aquatilis]MBO0930845.1 sterol desaturase family protein [Fibrella aquatilis]
MKTPHELLTFLADMAHDGSIFFRLVLPLYVGMIILEFGMTAWRMRQKPGAYRWSHRDGWTNVAVSSMNMTYDVVIGILLPFGLYYLLYTQYRVFTLPSSVWGWVAAFLIHDLIYYVDHRISHRTGLFWAFHSVHHSSQEYNVTVAARGFFLNGTLTMPLYYLMPILGMSPFMILVVNVVASLFGIFNHTRLVKHMGWLEYVLCTPSNHRVHHGTDAKYLDRNYGQVFIIWDYLFGSYQREEEEPTYGLTTQLQTNNPFAIQWAGIRWLWQQMKAANRLSDKLRYLWMPPGWRHDGPGQTAEEIRARTTQPQNVVLTTP